MNQLFRWLSFGVGWGVDRERAIEIAKEEVARRGLRWVDPVRVHRLVGDWEMWTDKWTRGGNLRIVIDGETGAVKRLIGPMHQWPRT